MPSTTHHPDLSWDTFCQHETYSCIQCALDYPGAVQQLPHCTLTFLPALATMIREKENYADPHHLLNKTVSSWLEGKETTVDKATSIVADGSVAPDGKLLISVEAAAQSVTVFLLVESATTSECVALLTGKGIETQEKLRVLGLNTEWLEAFMFWNCETQATVDVLLIDRDGGVIGLPHGTRTRTL